jgi:hypothetical protein
MGVNIGLIPLSCVSSPTRSGAPTDKAGLALAVGRTHGGAFNLNLLMSINRELAGTFDVDAFAHNAVYDEPAGRIECTL